MNSLLKLHEAILLITINFPFAKSAVEAQKAKRELTISDSLFLSPAQGPISANFMGNGVRKGRYSVINTLKTKATG